MDRDRAERLSLRRRPLVARLLEGADELAVIAGLGAPAWDCAAATGERALTFPLWGAMGGAAMMGLGLALAQPRRRVLTVTGDGELLMGLGALVTIGAAPAANLAIAVLDNERYGETGGQPTATAGVLDLAALARAAGFREALTVRDQAEVERARSLLLSAPGPVLVDFKVRAEDLPIVMPEKDGATLRDRFRRALGVA
ncbi:MAG: aldehyde dehydrogenase [Alphaproteobacteria bacterium]|nr:aldehyde dehydrogenase [Alphaproteobacteria bacterium]